MGWLALGVLDHMGLIEHGSNIAYSWRTELGQQVWDDFGLISSSEIDKLLS